MSANPRLVANTVITGCFGFPIGISFFKRDPKSILVSTVCVEGGHLEDPLNICEPEHGYETMVFLDGCSFFSIFTQKYELRRDAENGHADIVKKLRARELRLSIEVNYSVFDREAEQ